MAQSIAVSRKLENIGKGENKFIEVIKVSVTTSGSGTVDFSSDTFRVDGYISKLVYYADAVMTGGADVHLNQAPTDPFYVSNTRDVLGSALTNIPGATSQFHGSCVLDKDGVNSGNSCRAILCSGFYELKVNANSVADVSFDLYLYVSEDPVA